MAHWRQCGQPVEAGERPDLFDRAVELLLALTLIFMPLAFGAVEAWSEEIVLALMAALSTLLTTKRVVRRGPFPAWSWAVLPACLFLAVGTLQILPLPARVVEVLSPCTAATVRDLLGDLPGVDAVHHRMTLSLYPHVTTHDLRLVLAGMTVFVVVLSVFRTPAMIKRLLAYVSLAGAVVAVMAIAQVITRADKIYWVVPTGHGRADAGPFVNHSHLAQFMNLSIGASLALLMVGISEAFDGRRVTPSLAMEYLVSPDGKRLWLWSGSAVLGAASIFVSLSRGGIIAMLLAMSFTTVVLTVRRSLRGRGQLMALIAVGALVCILYIGFDAVYERLATLHKLTEADEGRWQIVKDIAVAWTRFPILGTGLGTHAVVYPMFDRSTIPALAAHAENEYAQTLEETGLVGFLSLAGFGIMIWAAYGRTVRRTRQPIGMAAYGLGLGLLAVMVQSLSDFGQHLPANFMVSVTFCAILLVLARLHTGPPKASESPRVEKRAAHRGAILALGIAAVIAHATVWIWVLLAANNARIAETHWNRAMDLEQVLMEKQWQGTDEDYATLIACMDNAVRYQPDHVEYHHWRAVYRWRSISRVTDPNTGQIVLVPEAVEFTKRIIGELNQSRILCPCYGPTYSLMGQLERAVSDDGLGSRHIWTGYRLAPGDPTACLVAGQLDAQQGRIEDVFVKLKRAVQLDGRLFAEVAGFFVSGLARPELAVDLAGDDIGRLTQTASLLAGLSEGQQLSQQVRSRLVELLQQKAQEPNAPAGVFVALAGIYHREKDTEAAIQQYRRALALDYGQTSWRYSLATLLADEGRSAEAIQEARICLRFRPDHAAAKRLIANLSAQPAGGGTDGRTVGQ